MEQGDTWMKHDASLKRDTPKENSWTFRKPWIRSEKRTSAMSNETRHRNEAGAIIHLKMS